MNQDRCLTCSNCGTPFLWTLWEQGKQYDQPPFCPGCRRLLPAEGRRRGLVKFYNQRRGWGFVTATDGLEIFVHRSELRDQGDHPLLEGDLVEFGVKAVRRGPQAADLQRLEVSSEQKN